MNRLRRIFDPTPAEQYEDKLRCANIVRELIEQRNCSTCIHYVVIPGFHPGFVTGADEECCKGRCPIDSCESYRLNPLHTKLLQELKNL